MVRFHRNKLFKVLEIFANDRTVREAVKSKLLWAKSVSDGILVHLTKHKEA